MTHSVVSPVSPNAYPPGPTGRGIFGTAREFQKAPLTYLTQTHKTYGDSLRYRFFLHLYGYSFVHPDANKHILQDNNANYTKQPHPSMLILKPVIGEGLLSSDGDFWRKQRRLAQPAFHRTQIANFARTFVESIQSRFEQWSAAARDGQAVAMDEELMALTLEIAGKTLFSIDLTGQAAQIGDAFDTANRIITDLSASPSLPIICPNSGRSRNASTRNALPRAKRLSGPATLTCPLAAAPASASATILP